MRGALPLAALLAALATMLGCDQVGAPLVDQHQGKVRIPIGACNPAPECVPPAVVERPLQRAERIDLARCGTFEPAECTETEPPQALPMAPDPNDDLDGGTQSDLEPHGDVASVPTSVQLCAGDVVALPQQLSCEHATSRNAPAGVAERLRSASWTDFNLTLESAEPRTVVLERAAVKNAFIELRGPVTLRIEDSDEIASLHLAGVPSEAGAPRLELEAVRASVIVIGDDQQAFAGAIDIRNSRLSGVQLIAEQLSAESSAIDDGAIDVRMLIATDAELTRLGISADRAVVSSTRIDRVQVARCIELTFVDAHLFATDIAPCSGKPVRLFGSSVSEGSLDGVFESDGSHFDGVRFGTRSTTELELWSSAVASSSFCDRVQRLTMAGGIEVKCALCASPTFVPDAVCALPKAKPDFALNVECPGLEPDAELEQCADPQPIRHRSVGML